MSEHIKFKRKVIKLGNGLYITVPMIWAKANSIKKGSSLEIHIKEDRLVIKLVKR